jgi:hypothetical protein
MAGLPSNAEILKRLAAIDPASAAVDRPRAERAVALHFEQLGLPARPFRWAADGPSGFTEIFSEAWERLRRSNEQDGPELTDRFEKMAEETRTRPYVEQLNQLFPEPDASEEMRAFRRHPGRRRQVRETAGRMGRGGTGPPGIGGRRGQRSVHHRAPGDVAGRLAPEPESGAARARLSGRPPTANGGGAHGGRAGGRAVALLAPARRNAPDSASCDESSSAAICTTSAGRRSPGPEGASIWSLRGQIVDRKAVESPAALDPACIEREPSPYNRGILMDRYGRDRYLSDLGGDVVAESPAGKLIRLRPPGREPFAFVEFRRPYPGSRAEYVLVPESVSTPEEGLAWTFGLTAAEYPLEDARDPYAEPEIGPLAREIIDRLRRVDRTRPLLDRAKATAALARRFPSSTRPGVRTRWFAPSELRSVRDIGRCGRRGELEDDAQHGEPGKFNDAFDSAAAVCRMREERSAVRALGGRPDHDVAFRASQAADVAALIHQGALTADRARFTTAWLPWVELYEAGVSGIWTSGGSIGVMPRPAMRFRNGRLHDDDGPAVSWEGGPRFHFQDGKQVREEE